MRNRACSNDRKKKKSDSHLMVIKTSKTTSDSNSGQQVISPGSLGVSGLLNAFLKSCGVGKSNSISPDPSYCLEQTPSSSFQSSKPLSIDTEQCFSNGNMSGKKRVLARCPSSCKTAPECNGSSYETIVKCEVIGYDVVRKGRFSTGIVFTVLVCNNQGKSWTVRHSRRDFENFHRSLLQELNASFERDSGQPAVNNGSASSSVPLFNLRFPLSSSRQFWLASGNRRRASVLEDRMNKLSNFLQLVIEHRNSHDSQAFQHFISLNTSEPAISPLDNRVSPSCCKKPPSPLGGHECRRKSSLSSCYIEFQRPSTYSSKVILDSSNGGQGANYSDKVFDHSRQQHHMARTMEKNTSGGQQNSMAKWGSFSFSSWFSSSFSSSSWSQNNNTFRSSVSGASSRTCSPALRVSSPQGFSNNPKTEDMQGVVLSNSADYFKNSKSSQSLNDYSILKVIGRGSFGTVLLAKLKSTGKLYAIKAISKDLINQEDKVRYVMCERSVLLQCNKQPYLNGLHSCFQTAKKLYFVLDYAPGGELFFHLHREGRFSENRARFYVCEMVQAIEFLHSRNVIYRDLKPENILLDGDGHIMLSDFGLSKEGVGPFTRTKTFCGTPEYLTPEQVLKHPYDRSVDWYCLGAVMYEMLMGLPPFYSKHHVEMYENILNQPLTFPKPISPKAQNLITRLLQRNPEDRLGYGFSGAEAVKAHPYFAGIDWSLVSTRSYRPPFKPNLSDSTDLSNFDTQFTKLNIPYSILVEATQASSTSCDDDFLSNRHNTSQSNNGRYNFYENSPASVGQDVFSGFCYDPSPMPLKSPGYDVYNDDEECISDDGAETIEDDINDGAASSYHSCTRNDLDSIYHSPL